MCALSIELEALGDYSLACGLEGGSGIGQKLAAERGVLVNDGQIGDAHGHQFLREALRFIRIAGAHVEDRTVLGLAQRHGTALGGDIWNLGFIHQPHDALVVGRSHAGDQRHGVGVCNHLAHVFFRTLGVIAVVHGHEFDFTAVDAARIGLCQACVQALLEFASQAGQRARSAQRAADRNRFAVHGVLQTHCAGRGCPEKACACGHQRLGELTALHGLYPQRKRAGL